MAFLAISGDPDRTDAAAVSITSCVQRSELPEKNSDMFVIEKLAYIMRKSKGLYRIEIDINKDYIFTLYTYAQTLEEYEKEKEEEEEG